MDEQLKNLIEVKSFSNDEIADKLRTIHATALRESQDLDSGNFMAIHTEDLKRVFHLYDNMFFENGCKRAIGETPLHFHLSNRMTRVGGKTERRIYPDDHNGKSRTEYTIAVSTALLFAAFRDDHRSIAVNGIECRDRLEAFQRIVEHEMIHLMEMIIWDKSSCRANRFQDIALRFFRHTDHRHALITPRERALVNYGVKVGDRVSFEFEGQTYVGIINRITRRATILVESETGTRYSNGKCHTKYYVPLSFLKPA